METQRKLRIVAVLCALIAGLSATAPARVIYVDDDATGANDGSSWENAFLRLQKALGVAGAGDEIRVAQGLYTPDQGAPQPQGPQGRTRSPGSIGLTSAADEQYTAFPLMSGVSLRGGFAGLGALDPNARDVERYETILSGDVKGNDKQGWGPWYPLSRLFQSDNSLHVVTSTGTDSTAVLDGFTITAATDSGMSNDNGSPSIMDCAFRRNAGQSGGGLKSDGGHPSLSRCAFEENFSWTDGGAISVRNGVLTLAECRFLSNAAVNTGGGIHSRECGLSLTDCLFEQNAADAGGGVSHYRSTLDLTGCSFEGNLARRGGAVFMTDFQSAAMRKCSFKANWAEDAGGAVYEQSTPLVLDSSATLDSCTFAGNTGTRAGALYLSGAYLPRQTVAIGNCIFTGNRADTTGGAIYGNSLLVSLANCTFAGNWAASWATLDWKGSRWLPGDEPAVILANCIVWDSEQSIFRTFLRWDGQLVDSGEVITIMHSDVQGGWFGEGNIDADPCFAAPGYWVDATSPRTIVPASYANAVWVDGDYHLKSQAGRWDPAGEGWVLDDVTSPCIDAGDPNTPVADEPEPNGGRINMGAYGGTAEASMSLNTGP